MPGLEAWPERPDFTISAPSWVMPGGIAANAAFLAGSVDQCGLCFFETAACLNYSQADLPADLASLPLSWHIHMPLDLPWQDARETAQICASLAAKAAHLDIRYIVIHPPDCRNGWPDGCRSCRKKLQKFADCWRKLAHGQILLENVPWCDVQCLGRDFMDSTGLGLCLDVAHALAYGQKELLRCWLLSATALVHWSAPGDGDRHLPLTELAPAQWRLAAQIMARLPATATHMLEIFNWNGIEASLPKLAGIHNHAKSQACHSSRAVA